MADRRYDVWAGNPKGIPEDKTKCVAEVMEGRGWHFYQCSRRRGFGPNGEYCKQHTKKIERQEQQKREWERGKKNQKDMSNPDRPLTEEEAINQPFEVDVEDVLGRNEREAEKTQHNP